MNNTPEIFDPQAAEAKRRQRRRIGIVAGVVAFSCCCCASAITLWYTGDYLVDLLNAF